MGLHLHRAQRTDLLAEGLATLLASPLPDPFTDEVVVVGAKGVERWLTQRLSHRLGTSGAAADGVCAGVRFLSPNSLISLLLGRDYDDVWEPDRLVWPLLEVIDASLGEAWCAPLSRHLGYGMDAEAAAARSTRRYSVALRLARLFASYARQRPSLLAEWEAGHSSDGAGLELDDDLAWQPPLWRRLLDRVDEASPLVRHQATCQRLREGESVGLDLPERVSLFGHTRLAVTEVELLAALAMRRDVHLWLPQASPQLTHDLAEVSQQGPVLRADDDSASVVGHQLLASLGRDTRELQRVLAPLGGTAHEYPDPDPLPNNLLGWLQADIAANRSPEEQRSLRTVTQHDRSVQVHACHGPARQVEVLREVLVGLLEDDPTLEPRDIVVMCPDVETYAPLIHAGFGLGDAVPGAHPAHQLRVRLADRSLTATNPLLAVAEKLVELAGGRVEASAVLDLLGSQPCRRRFRLDDDNLETIGRWVAESGVRWGLDVDWRARFSMPGIGHNTWQTGLERLLAGVAMSGDDLMHLGPALPLDDVSSSDIELAGALAEFVDRLATCLRGLDGSKAVGEWLATLSEGVLSLTDVPQDQAWQRSQLERELARTADAAQSASTSLTLADLRALLGSRLGGRPTRANFRTGTLTVCTMVPMRSVPHRVVCLLGMDDGVFPRSRWVDGDDALARAPRTGEDDRRSTDRQLLLDAVMAARSHLVVCYSGADEHNGANRPPAVPVGELIDALAATAVGAEQQVLVRHPLQAHHWRNLTVGHSEPGSTLTSVGSAEPLSFDQTALAGAEAASGPRAKPRPFLDQPLPPAPRGDVSLEQLKRLLGNPVAEFCRSRLMIGNPLEAAEEHDAIPIDLDGLQAWQIGDRLLRDLIDGVNHQSVIAAERMRGTLPPNELGVRAFNDILVNVQQIWKGTSALRTHQPRSVDVRVDLGNGRTLSGTVSGVWGHRCLAIGYSRLKARQRLNSWVDLLALSASYPDKSWTSHAIGRERGRAAQVIIEPVDHRALGWLRDLVDIYDEAMDRPIPAPLQTSLAWQFAKAEGQSPEYAADREWTTTRSSRFPNEDQDPWHVRVFGAQTPLDSLIAAGLPGYAERIWAPMLAASQRVRPLDEH